MMKTSSLLLRRSFLAGSVRVAGPALSATRCAALTSSISSSSTGTTSSKAIALTFSARGAATRTPYGTVPSDIEGSRGEGKPSEEEVYHRERLRRASAGGTDRTAEEAQADALGGNIAGYNPFDVLGLKAGASNQTIRLRYHELMKEVHPDMAADGVGDIPRLNQINKAYELITKSPTLDRRYRNLVSDTQYFYYRFLPEWMARNVDEMPRYWSWVKWRTPGAFHVFILCIAFYALGRFFAEFPKLTTVFLVSVAADILLHTMIAPATLSMLFLYSIMAYRSYDMAWLTSPKGFLRRELGY